MRTLIVEDNQTERRLLQFLLSPLGPCEVSVDGQDVIGRCEMQAQSGEPYDLICLDIRLPQADGQVILREIRALERGRGVPNGRGARVIMTTNLQDSISVLQAFREQCDGYLVKPVDHTRLFKLLQGLHLIGNPGAVGVS